MRAWPIRDLHVTAGPGTPALVDVSIVDSDLVVRIGDPDVTLTGPHAYRLRYTTDAALTPVETGWSVWFDAFSSWRTPVTRAELIVYDAPVLRAECFVESSPCDRLEISDSRTLAVATDLPPNTSFTVRADLRPGTFPDAASPLRADEVHLTPPELTRDPPIDDLLTQTRAKGRYPYGFLVSLSLLGLTTFVLVWDRRRSRRRTEAFSPQALSATFASFSASTSSKLPLPPPAPVLVDPELPPPVEFLPPGDLPPAHLALLYGQKEDSVLLAATVVDLTARSVIDLHRISEHIWQLHWNGVSHSAQAPFEMGVASTLFAGAPVVTIEPGVSVGKMKAVAEVHAKRVRTDLAAWGHLTSPRAPWRCDPVWLRLALPMVSLPTAAVLQTGAISAILVMVAGALFNLAILQPLSAPDNLTELGRAMRFRVRGFVSFMEHSEAHHALLATHTGLLREYLGYAVALGLVGTWTRSFAAVPEDVPTSWLFHLGQIGILSSVLAPTPRHP